MSYRWQPRKPRKSDRPLQTTVFRYACEHWGRPFTPDDVLWFCRFNKQPELDRKYLHTLLYMAVRNKKLVRLKQGLYATRAIAATYVPPAPRVIKRRPKKVKLVPGKLRDFFA